MIYLKLDDWKGVISFVASREPEGNTGRPERWKKMMRKPQLKYFKRMLDKQFTTKICNDEKNNIIFLH